MDLGDKKHTFLKREILARRLLGEPGVGGLADLLERLSQGKKDLLACTSPNLLPVSNHAFVRTRTIYCSVTTAGSTGLISTSGT